MLHPHFVVPCKVPFYKETYQKIHRHKKLILIDVKPNWLNENTFVLKVLLGATLNCQESWKVCYTSKIAESDAEHETEFGSVWNHKPKQNVNGKNCIQWGRKLQYKFALIKQIIFVGGRLII